MANQLSKFSNDWQTNLHGIEKLIYMDSDL